MGRGIIGSRESTEACFFHRVIRNGDKCDKLQAPRDGGGGLGMEQESWNRDRFGEGLGRSLDFTQRAVEGL